MNAHVQPVDPRDAAFIIPRSTVPWGEPFLAGLPHLWVGVSIALGKLGGEVRPDSAPSLLSGLSLASLAVFAAVCLAVTLYAWRRSWPLWTASWYSYTAWLGIIALGLAAVSLGEDRWVTNLLLLLAVLTGLVLGYLILFRASRLHALLVALFLMPVLPQLSLEAIPDGIEAFLSIFLGLLAAIVAVAVVRWWSWAAGVTLALGANLIAGVTLTYISLYLTDTPNYYGDSIGDGLLLFGFYFGIALLLFLGPAGLIKVWSMVAGRRQAGH